MEKRTTTCVWSFLIEFLIKKIVDLHLGISNNTDRPYILFIQLPLVTCYRPKLPYHTGIPNHRPYSDVASYFVYSFLCMCLFSLCKFIRCVGLCTHTHSQAIEKRPITIRTCPVALL